MEFSVYRYRYCYFHAFSRPLLTSKSHASQALIRSVVMAAADVAPHFGAELKVYSIANGQGLADRAEQDAFKPVNAWVCRSTLLIAPSDLLSDLSRHK